MPEEAAREFGRWFAGLLPQDRVRWLEAGQTGAGFTIDLLADLGCSPCRILFSARRRRRLAVAGLLGDPTAYVVHVQAAYGGDEFLQSRGRQCSGL